MWSQTILIDFVYILSAALFIFGLKRLGSVRTARQGNFLAATAMLLGAGVTLLDSGITNYTWIFGAILIGAIVGVATAHFIQMTAMPQLVAIFNGFGGLASVGVAASAFVRTEPSGFSFVYLSIIVGTIIGAVTFSGSLIAFGKLQGIIYAQALAFPLQGVINIVLMAGIVLLSCWLFMPTTVFYGFWILIGLSLLLGVLIVIAIGGADMPVVISILNSCSGIAAAMAGFVLMNKVLIVAGSLVGAAGLILTGVMCRAMNRSLMNVLFSGFGKVEKVDSTLSSEYTNVKSCTSEEAAMIFEGVQRVVIVPGYGLAVSRAQHAVHELQKILEKRGIDVKYGIHPVAGRMPGHMNVLLAEAEVPYDRLYEMDRINSEFESTDVVLIIGANDVTNPVARTERGSPIYGMPILDVDKARAAIVVKRSLSPGYAGIKNPLFENDKTLMLFDDAKRAIEGLVKELSR